MEEAWYQTGEVTPYSVRGDPYWDWWWCQVTRLFDFCEHFGFLIAAIAVIFRVILVKSGDR